MALERKYLKDYYPDIRRYWNEEKNKKDFDSVHLYSKLLYWWKCPDCGREWKEIAQTIWQKKVLCECQIERNTAAEYPDVYKYWDIDKNTVDFNRLAINSKKKYWWKCPDCGYEWKQRVSNQKKAGIKCPNCRRLHTKLVDIHPKIRDYWDEDKNAIALEDVILTTRTTIHLKCPICGHTWQSVANFYRVNWKYYCPKCKMAEKNILANAPELKEYWDNVRNVEAIEKATMGVPYWFILPDGRRVYMAAKDIKKNMDTKNLEWRITMI